MKLKLADLLAAATNKAVALMGAAVSGWDWLIMVVAQLVSYDGWCVVRHQL